MGVGSWLKGLLGGRPSGDAASEEVRRDLARMMTEFKKLTEENARLKEENRRLKEGKPS